MMLTWALKRQIIYITILVLFFSTLGFIIIYPQITKAPSCTDGKQNGEETGVDCGGSCLKACIVEVDEISILWARTFKVIPGRYNAVAYLVNHNQNEAIQKINYRFRFGDAKNVYIGKREGSTFVPPGGNFAVFEPGIDIGSSIPVYTTFEFTEMPVWLQVSQEKINQLKVLVSNIQLVDEATSPRLSATIKNNSLFTIPNVGVVAILYDAGGNAISTSRTYFDQLAPLENTEINFTWPEPLPGEVVEKEIIPMYNIFSAKLQ
ncbi:MAG: Glucose/sorbosone dehydrogenase [Candidatus Nomurabacteria bacterium GW2011_GWB1_40_7]|uniref:Glucose/sorbosone dehydrogenase n=1 Tax=Candidatus Nomurabacteria bacterium GW2011_GWB1_40_7 TaxID=1618744 RepID=A0A0G0VCG4_9BACT|nr:MAG: Glucose/sorbosone dehydrogenase [Candidatus Nomurabacteria bacterium GW2011_GWB1_40_7]